ncbi:MAG TPA: VOC family protein [Acidobacteriaceae bacterium]|nr:VOC family protein [Acidobacteriaceae bacterium]
MNTTLNHINLSVAEVAPIARFFQQVFAFRIIHEQGSSFAVLSGADGFVLTLMIDKSVTDETYPRNFHIGFFQPDKAAVEQLHARILELGFDAPAPGILRTNTFGFYASAPGRILVEVSTNI